MSSALSEGDPIMRKLAVAELIAQLGPDNVDDVLAAFENAPRSEETSRDFRDFLYAWARFAGEEAVAYAMSSDRPGRGSYNAVQALSGWAATDALAAKDYVATMDDGESKQWMHVGVMRELAKQNLDEAIVFSESNVKSRARGRQMDLLAREIVEQRGANGLKDWVNGIDHTDENGNDLLSYKQYAVGIALDRLASEDPAVALEFITENAREPFLTSGALERAARNAAGPIDEELGWLAKLPAEVEGRRHAIGERFEDYIRSDFAAAGEWLASQPLGPTYDEAIQDYAWSAARDDRGAALAWAARISDPQIKADTLKRLAQGQTGGGGDRRG